MRAIVLLTCLLVAALASGAAAQKKCTAKLIKHAALPSRTFAKLPPNVPKSFKVSGKFDNPLNRRNNVLGSVDKGTETKLPVPGQPVQGFSGLKTLKNKSGNPTGQFLVLTDNGYGNKFNSPDSMLTFHHVTPNFKAHTVKVDRTVFLRDPNRVVPFAIANEHTSDRYLTGADLDPESIQNIGNSIFIGEEFGPYLIETTTSGVVKAFYDITAGNLTFRSPENLLTRLPGSPADLATVSFNVRRSKGFEGMAASPDGKFLYPMLEGAVWDSAAGGLENVGGIYYLRIFKFSVAAKAFDPAFNAKYPLENMTNSLGDFNMVDSKHALVIERDDGEGDARKACSVANVTGCFKNPARFKRVYLIDITQRDSNGFVRKLAYVDLLDIKDPDNVAAWGTMNGVFTFPFVTIEGVDAYGAHMAVENDNNFPGSQGRVVGKNDNNEFIILDVGKFFSGTC